MNYEQALAYIAGLAPRGWRLGLDRMQAFVDKIGLQDSLGAPGGPQFIHVAGTNGKGSVTAYLQSILVWANYRTGAFFSPFVYDPRERVQFEREYISKEELAQITQELIPIAESFSETPFGGITEFEFKTALGFLFWKRKRCEWVALEVGLGGRLDATNVVTPRASIIVSIGLDHTSVLGHTLEEIAFEKAGIIKPNVPVVVGQMAPEALAVIERVAEENQAPIWRFGKEVLWTPVQMYDLDDNPVEMRGRVDTPAGSHNFLKPGIKGYMQDHNLAIAVAALDAARVSIPLLAFQDAPEYVSVPGRFEKVPHHGKSFLLDGAHNPDAAKVLVRSLRDYLKENQGIILLTGMVAGHEPEVFYRELVPLIKGAHVVPIDFHRALAPKDVASALTGLGIRNTAHNTLQEGINAAEAEARDEDLVLVTGSFYLVGEVGRLLNAKQ